MYDALRTDVTVASCSHLAVHGHPQGKVLLILDPGGVVGHNLAQEVEEEENWGEWDGGGEVSK